MASPILSPDGLWKWNGKEWIPYKILLDNYDHTNLLFDPPPVPYVDEIKPHYPAQSNPIPDMINLPVPTNVHDISNVKQHENEDFYLFQTNNNPKKVDEKKSEDQNTTGLEKMSIVLEKKGKTNDAKKVDNSTTTSTSDDTIPEGWSGELQSFFWVIFVVGILVFTPIVSQHQTIEETFSLSEGKSYFYDINCPDGCDIRINVTAMAYGTLELITVEGSGYGLCNGGYYYPSLSSSISGENHFATFLEPGSYSIIFDNSDCGNVPAISYGGLVVFEIELCKPKFNAASIVSEVQCFVKDEIL
jgi:hypothetical protein